MAGTLVVGHINGKFDEFRSLIDLKKPAEVYVAGNFFGPGDGEAKWSFYSALDALYGIDCTLWVMGGEQDAEFELGCLAHAFNKRKIFGAWFSSTTFLTFRTGQILLLRGKIAQSKQFNLKTRPIVDCMITNAWDSDVLSFYRPARWFFAGRELRRGRTAHTRWLELGELDWSWLRFRDITKIEQR